MMFSVAPLVLTSIVLLDISRYLITESPLSYSHTRLTTKRRVWAITVLTLAAAVRATDLV